MIFFNIFKLVSLHLICIFSPSYEKKVDNFCGHGWTTFNEEKCFKAFKPALSFVDAQSYCASRGGYLQAHLPTVNSQKEQDFLQNFLSTHEQFKNKSFWLGAERGGSDQEQNFKWTSNQVELDHSSFTNWAPGSPRPSTDSVDYCLAMTVNSSGQWYDEPCTERKHVLCERPPQWMLEKMQQTLAKLEKTFSQFLTNSFTVISVAKNATLIAENALNAATDATSGAKKAFTAASTAISLAKNSTDTAVSAIFTAENATKTAADATETAAKIAKTTINLTIPLGFIYVQLPKEKSPQEIWPNWMSWTDVSSTYDSVFFRVAGSKGAAAFGDVQEEFSPHIDEIKSAMKIGPSIKWNVKISRDGGWTGYVQTADYLDGNKTRYTHFLNFHTAPGEVRPRNMAVKVWKRTG